VLEFLGLDETATAVYHALLAAVSGPADISVVTGLPEGDIRSALGALAGLNLVRPPLGTSGGWRPIRPELGFAALLQEQEAALAALRAAVAAADATWSAGLQYPAGPVERVEDWRDALTQANRLAAHAAAECLQVMPAEPEPLALLHADLARYKTAVTRGARIRTLHHDSTRSDPVALAYARRAALAGAEVRTAAILPLPMVVCDGQVALIQAGPGRHEAALCIREPSIVAMLGAVFDNAWETAAPLNTRITPDKSTGLTPGEQELLRLLAGGATDAAASSRLGVSVSTVRRQMKDLMTRLQATSRFQAGVNAAQRAWL
jgi:DNA-binding CsgD family transcriptional regulator